MTRNGKRLCTPLRLPLVELRAKICGRITARLLRKVQASSGGRSREGRNRGPEVRFEKNARGSQLRLGCGRSNLPFSRHSSRSVDCFTCTDIWLSVCKFGKLPDSAVRPCLQFDSTSSEPSVRLQLCSCLRRSIRRCEDTGSDVLQCGFETESDQGPR
ncbi:hypothetical protein VTK26DRAFT_4813 [Humicola hyalothermophila]